MTDNNELRTVWWDADAVWLIDQQLLPQREVIVRCTTLDDVARAIKTMQVRGAPAIGCMAAFSMGLVAHLSRAADVPALRAELAHAKSLLDAQRPTAVNLAWATSRMLRFAEQSPVAGRVALSAQLLDEAQRVADEDLAMCYAIGDHGAQLVPLRGQVLTHCNAGGLAGRDYGTALAPIRTAHSHGHNVHVYVDETRPFLQGARLTAWELHRAGIPMTLITDSMASYFMQRGAIDCVIVGADRIMANGYTANKIGTYSLAVLAQAHGLPFYVAAPSSTVDSSLVAT